jgi:hypothetical protein
MFLLSSPRKQSDTSQITGLDLVSSLCYCLLTRALTSPGKQDFFVLGYVTLNGHLIDLNAGIGFIIFLMNFYLKLGKSVKNKFWFTMPAYQETKGFLLGLALE